MKKNFLAKLGHFFLVSALLFNTFGVAFVYAGTQAASTSLYSTALKEDTAGQNTEFFRVNNKTADQMTVSFSISSDSATIGDDVTIVGHESDYADFSETIDPNSFITLSANVIDDTVVEGTEQFQLTITGVSSTSSQALADLTANNPYKVNITDNDEIYQPVFTATNNTVTEGAQASETDGVAIATLSNQSDQELDYDVTFSSDSAVIGTDYSLYYVNSNGNHILVTSDSTFTVPANTDYTLYAYASGAYDNSVYEGTKTASLSISQAVNATDATDVIADFSDNPVTFSFDIQDDETNTTTTTVSTMPDKSIVLNTGFSYSVEDVLIYFDFTSDSTAVITATSSNPDAVTVTYDTTNGLTIYGKALGEADVTVTADDNGTVYEDTFHVTVTKNLVSFDVSNDSINENGGTYTVKINSRIAAATSGDGGPEGTDGLWVYFTLDNDNSATISDDFTLDAATTTDSYYAIIPVGDTSTTVHLSIVDDTVVDPAEQIGLTINNATPNSTAGVDTSANTFTLTINDNDGSANNHAPTTTGSKISQSMDLYQTHTVTIASTTIDNLFTDEDAGDTLKYSVTGNTTSSVATGSFENNDLTITGLSVGTTTLEITATDSYDASASTTIDVSISDSNIAPTVENPIETQYLDLYTTSSVTISHDTLQAIFTDSNEDRLTLSLTDNSDTSVVTTTEGDNQLYDITLTALHTGTSTIEITADDGHNGLATTTFDVIVTDSTPADNGGDTGSSGGSSSGGSSSSGGGSALLPNTAPKAEVGNGQEVTIAVNTEITFDASGSSDKENNIRFYFWNFGDGTPEVYYTTPTTTHTYTEVGTYTLTTKVKDSYGAESSAEITVHVVNQNGSNTGTETNSDTNNNTETGNTSEENNTTSTTPVEETGSTTETNTGSNTNSSNATNSNSTTGETNNNTEENTTPEQNTTENNPENNSENNNGETVTTTPEDANQNLPTWIKIIFGSGALAAVAGAGIAINRVRKNV